MPFSKALVTAPAAIGDITIRIVDMVTNDLGAPPVVAHQTYEISIEILTANGQGYSVERFNLLPHLTAGQVTAINNLLAAMRAKANEVLP